MHLYLFSFLDLNGCYVTGRINSFKNDPMNGICELGFFLHTTTRDECEYFCLDDSRCYGLFYSTQSCIHYIYDVEPCQRYFPRNAIFFIHKGNLVM